jgi:hypothetical protein
MVFFWGFIDPASAGEFFVVAVMSPRAKACPFDLAPRPAILAFPAARSNPEGIEDCLRGQIFDVLNIMFTSERHIIHFYPLSCI